VICESVTLELPVFFNVTACVELAPTTSFPKFRLFADTEIVRIAAVPEPFNAMVSVPSDALLFNVILPTSLTKLLAVNPTVKLTVCAGANVCGIASPLILNPLPLSTALEMLRLVPPVFFSCIVCEFPVATATAPKLTLAGVAANFALPLDLALALPVEPITASRIIAILTTIRNCTLRSLWLLRMVSGETAKILSWKNDGRGQMDCIQ